MNQTNSKSYQSTRNLLNRYRDVHFQLEVCTRQLSRVSSLKDNASLASKIREYRLFMRTVEETANVLRKSHRHGEEYYWILYFSFLSPHEIRNVEDMLETLAPYTPAIASPRTYYRLRKQAIEAFALLFWGFPEENSSPDRTHAKSDTSFPAS